MIVIGLLFGFVLTWVYFWIFERVLKAILKKKSGFSLFLYFISYILRVALFGVLIFVFIKYKIGDPISLIIGITAAAIIFILKKNKENKGD